MMHLSDEVGILKGVGPKKEARLNAMGIRTIEDLVHHYPRDYEDRRTPVAIADLTVGKSQLVCGFVKDVYKSPYRRGKQLTKITITDGMNLLGIVYFNAPYVANNLKVGEEYYFYGKVGENRGQKQMAHPEFAKGIEGLVPVYPLTKGIGQNDLRKYEKAAMPAISEVEEILPPAVTEGKNLCTLAEALRNIHFPEDEDGLNDARKRIIYDELFTMQLGLLMMKRGKVSGKAHKADENIFIDSLPYKLTDAQARAAGDLCRDIAADMAMNWLLQGDGGSGKTVVAEVAMYKVVKSGAQAAFMAPTDLLMKQHYENMTRDFAPHGITVGYLSGRMSAAEKRDTLERLAAGEIDIIVGTHALIQEGVEFDNLGLVITDEQHRFGVNQRMTLKGKGAEPDILVMTATPIPRTLAVVFYGDLDVSVIDELPPGRMPIDTHYYSDRRRMEIYKRLTSQLDAGRQVYVVCPLIEESDAIECRSATGVYEELSDFYRGRSVALLHGEMKQDEKDEVMERFAAGEIDVLVSTVVIEVGIDVANATVMIIENAERFGLAQLHQLRGRVGRGSHQSYCMLILGSGSDVAVQRAKVLAESTDGFYIAEKDLDLRGPGEVFGTRQHGIPDNHLTDMISHIDIMEELRVTAMEVLSDDPALEKPENAAVRRRVQALFSGDTTINL
ncbi:MAG: ATP-dependent DNA helicase RecG [Firmicutes bacterium]|nr:ATP-dependent DNA helicase RecG [Bacillota bacterium]